MSVHCRFFGATISRKSVVVYGLRVRTVNGQSLSARVRSRGPAEEHPILSAEDCARSVLNRPPPNALVGLPRLRAPAGAVAGNTGKTAASTQSMQRAGAQAGPVRSRSVSLVKGHAAEDGQGPRLEVLATPFDCRKGTSRSFLIDTCLAVWYWHTLTWNPGPPREKRSNSPRALFTEELRWQ